MIFIILIISVFILPIVTAFCRGHRNLIPITIVNVFLGPTVIGYFLCLAWSFNDNVEEKRKPFAFIKDWHLLTIFAVLFIATACFYKFVFLKHHKPQKSKGLFQTIITEIVKDAIKEEVGKPVERAIKPFKGIL